MSFEDNASAIQRDLRGAGYEPIHHSVDLAGLAKEDMIEDCEIVARKDFFNVAYMEAESNWRSIASQVIRKNANTRLMITRYRDSHHIFTTVRDHGTRNAKPRHVVLETGSKPKLMRKFMLAIKTDPTDDHLAVDKRVQAAFDKFAEYKQTVDEFGKNLGDIIKKTEAAIDKAIIGNRKYETRAKKMLKMCREVISDRLDIDDIKSMLLQHVLTYRIFALVYDVTDFHETNTVAKSLEELRQTLDMSSVRISYKTMELIAESLTETDEKQEFLKKIYETFYEKYDPDRADKDGIVYTPAQAVNFMVRSTEQLLQLHFGKSMSDDGVTLLDPATGTGTFLVHVMKQIGPDKIKQKYAKDLHANEISILPYYIATLNIEHAYSELTGEYREFENICWMDTLDSGTKNEKIESWIEHENVQRILKQQESRIQVAIGNPPYNAVQTSLNNANPADKYDHLDKRIRDSYYKNIRTTNKNKAFDMYKRFLKWSSDRIKGNGMVVFISNSSFLDAKADAGVRRALYDEFDYIYVVNLKGNARLCGEERRRERGNVFGGQARVGVCISFFVKTGEGCSKIRYAEIADYAERKEKLQWLDDSTLLNLKLREIDPDENASWLNQTDNDFESLVPVITSTLKESIFSSHTVGVAAAKDDWVYDLDHENLELKMKYYITTYNALLKEYKRLHTEPSQLIGWVDKKIKWSDRTLKELKRQHKIKYSVNNIEPTLYRPFVIKHQYYADVITERPRLFREYLPDSHKNLLIVFPNPATNARFGVVGTDLITDLGCLDVSQNIPIWLYNNLKQTNNVTEYGLEHFRKHYKNQKIRTEDVFYYVYAVFNDPKYEKTYRHNLRREFPRIPLAKNFTKWSKIGKELFGLHCNFNDAEEYNLRRVDKRALKNEAQLSFKEDKKDIKIVIDDATILDNVPLEVLDWTLKCKTPLEWVLEFYKETKNQIRPESSNDERVRRWFSTYQFKDHKEEVITLLRKVTTVCVKTVRLRKELENMEWGPQPKLEFTPIQRKQKETAKKTKRKKPRSRSISLTYQKKLYKDGSSIQTTFKRASTQPD